MADIRINALATTAASTASDDFVAVDGSANGTRKLNAFSPTFGGNATFGGNLTVSGTGTSAINNLSITPTSGHVYLTGPSAAGKFITLQNGNATGGINFRDSAGNEVGSYYQVTDAWTFSKNTTISGNLTVSGTGVGVLFNADATYGMGVRNVDGSFDRLGLTGGASLSGSTYTARYANPIVVKLAPDVGVFVVNVDSGKTPGNTYTPTPRLTVSATGTELAGNLTVSGTGTSSVAGNFGLGTTTPTAGQLHISGNSDSGSAPNRPRIGLTNLAGTAQTWTIQAWQTSGDANLSIYRTAAAGGILLASTGGSVGVGVTSFSGSGALELATHTTRAGGIGFGTASSIWTAGTTSFRFGDSTNTAQIAASGSGVFIGTSAGASGNLVLTSGSGTTALTLDSGQNATFAGAKITLGGSGNGEVEIRRASNSNGSSVAYRTSSTLKWYHGLRGLVNDNWYLQNEVAGNTALFFDAATSNATFAGAVTTNGSTLSAINNTNVSTTATDIAIATSVGGLYFVTGYNTSGGAQGTWLLMARGTNVTTISSDNNTGLTVTYSISSGKLQAATASGTIALIATAITR